MAPPQTLQAPLLTLTTLLGQCRLALQQSRTAAAAAGPEPGPDPLALLHDAATLAKAHTTRLAVSLSPPITLDAAAQFMGELSASAVPALAAGAGALAGGAQGAALGREAVRAVDALLRALEELCAHVGTDSSRLVDTGVVWKAADRVAALRARGLAGVVDGAVLVAADMVDDTWAELKEWVDNEDLDGSDSEEDEDMAEQGFWDRPTRKGRIDETTRAHAEGALKKIKLVTILFGAARKRRLGGDGVLGDVARLDRMASLADVISATTDDIGMAFFDDEELEFAVSRAAVLCDAGADWRNRTMRGTCWWGRRPSLRSCACSIAMARRINTRPGSRRARRRWRNLHDTTTSKQFEQ